MNSMYYLLFLFSEIPGKQNPLKCSEESLCCVLKCPIKCGCLLPPCPPPLQPQVRRREGTNRRVSPLPERLIDGEEGEC